RLHQVRVDDVAIDGQRLIVSVGIDDAELPVIEHQRCSGRLASDGAVAGDSVVDIVERQRLATRGGAWGVESSITQPHLTSTLKGRVHTGAEGRPRNSWDPLLRLIEPWLMKTPWVKSTPASGFGA